ncbi:hypothetical protein F4778DRAFT_788422 [Xylariomycetidae sp. FL2044]|nr:hypothetical protein F4778DRAFT_788422 [Xylariomycetidae sp. FL2044]
MNGMSAPVDSVDNSAVKLETVVEQYKAKNTLVDKAPPEEPTEGTPEGLQDERTNALEKEELENSEKAQAAAPEADNHTYGDKRVTQAVNQQLNTAIPYLASEKAQVAAPEADEVWADEAALGVLVEENPDFEKHTFVTYIHTEISADSEGGEGSKISDSLEEFETETEGKKEGKEKGISNHFEVINDDQNGYSGSPNGIAPEAVYLVLYDIVEPGPLGAVNDPFHQPHPPIIDSQQSVSSQEVVGVYSNARAANECVLAFFKSEYESFHPLMRDYILWDCRPWEYYADENGNLELLVFWPGLRTIWVKKLKASQISFSGGEVVSHASQVDHWMA